MILYFYAEFGKGFAFFAFGGEYWVVAKTFCTTLLGSYLSTDNALEEVFFAILYEGNDRAELCRAVCLSVEFGQELLRIGFGVVAVGVSIARSVYTRATA